MLDLDAEVRAVEPRPSKRREALLARVAIGCLQALDGDVLAALGHQTAHCLRQRTLHVPHLQTRTLAIVARKGPQHVGVAVIGKHLLGRNPIGGVIADHVQR